MALGGCRAGSLRPLHALHSPSLLLRAHDKSQPELEHCMQIVAVGCCNHKAVCAWCCLRMRLKYNDSSCPLCKQNQPQVGPTCRNNFM